MAVYYIFDWDCTITQRNYNYFMHDYYEFKMLYNIDEEYKTLYAKYISKIKILPNERTEDALNIQAKRKLEELKTNSHIRTYMDILDCPILTYIVELFFGIHRFFALQDMFQVLRNKKINIIILTITDITPLLKILLYGYKDINSQIEIYVPQKIVSLLTNKLETKNNKIFYVDDFHTFDEIIRLHHNLSPNKYMFYDKLEHNGSGLTLDDIRYICNFEFAHE